MYLPLKNLILFLSSLYFFLLLLFSVAVHLFLQLQPVWASGIARNVLHHPSILCCELKEQE
jgi:hypothetical protein